MLLLGPLLNKFISNTTILRSVELLCFILILAMEYKLYKNKCLKSFHSYEKLLYGSLLIVSIGIIVRGEWPDSPKDWWLHFLQTPMYFLPFIIVSLKNRIYIVELIRMFYKISLLVIPLWLINYTDLVQDDFKGEGIGSYLPFISAFMLGLGTFFNRRQRILNIVLWTIYFILMMLNGRRNVSFSLLIYAFIAYIFLTLAEMKKNKLKFVFTILMSVFVIIILLLSIDSLTSGIFDRMANRANEDTRSGVEELFFADFVTSPPSEWIWGRGMDGGYYQIVINEETGESTDNRTVIETGYLNMILKGGITYTLCVILIMILAIKRGYTQNNKIDAFIATILCTYFIDLYTTNPVTIFNVRSILFWFCVSVISEKKNLQSNTKIIDERIS